MGLSLRELRQATTSILEFAGLERFAHLELRHYSSGMAARLAYAVAFRAVRDVLILDEIFAVGDAEFKERCQARYRQLHAAGHSMLLVSHDPRTIAAVLRSRTPPRRRPHRPRRSRTGGRRSLSVDSSGVAAPGLATPPSWYDDPADLGPAAVLQPWRLHRRGGGERASPRPSRISKSSSSTMGRRTLRRSRSFRRGRSRGFEFCRTENRGLPAARNHAARHASGAVFCALDADDRLAPDLVREGSRRCWTGSPSVAFVSHWLETFGDERWTWMPERCDLPALLARNAVNGAALVRREAFEAVGGYDESMREGCEDWDFWLRLVEGGRSGAIIPEVLFYYRRRADSMSRSMLEESAYRRPLDALVTKHAASYRRHLIEVILAKEREALHLGREIGALEQDRLSVLEPALRRAREDVVAVAAKAAKVRAQKERDDELVGLRARAADLQAEVQGLRASWSWRISAPLRRVYELLLRSGR